DAAEALGARRLRDALETAVEAPARLLDGIDQQIADDRHVPLSPRANDRAQVHGRAGVADVVNIEAVIVARDEHVSGEDEIGVREIEEARPRLGPAVARVLAPAGRAVGVRAAVDRLRSVPGRFGGPAGPPGAAQRLELAGH